MPAAWRGSSLLLLLAAQFDLSTQVLWPADLCIVRDVLFHFDPTRALNVLRRINASGCKYFLATTFPQYDPMTNVKRASRFHAGRGFGSFAPWDLQGAPFHLVPPLLLIGYDGDRQPPNSYYPTRAMG